MDCCDDIDVYPPRVFLEAKASHFSSCSVSIKDVEGCTFERTQPAGKDVYPLRQNLSGESSFSMVTQHTSVKYIKLVAN